MFDNQSRSTLKGRRNTISISRGSTHNSIMRSSFVRLFMHTLCVAIILWVFTSTFADAAEKASIDSGSAEAPPPFSRSLSLSSASVATFEEPPLMTDVGDATEDDYGGWDPAPYSNGGNPGPIPHPA